MKRHRPIPVGETPARRSIPGLEIPAEADRFAAVYRHRAREIRRCRGLSPNCDFGAPDDDLVHAIAAGSALARGELEGSNAVVG